MYHVFHKNIKMTNRFIRRMFLHRNQVIKKKVFKSLLNTVGAEPEFAHD